MAQVRAIVPAMSTYRVIQLSDQEWAVEFTPVGHKAATIRHGFKTEAQAQAELAALLELSDREAEQP
jgi:hypothetical protein